ncbi:MAG: low molecular weight protein-tyrosine-phosphatase [Pseudomonadota bacterium]
MRILCVCLGNICRSPTAEAVLRGMGRARGLAIDVDSAGTSSWHIGDAPYGPAVRAAAARGYDLTGQRARQINSGDFERFDLVLAMDTTNLEALRRLRPQGVETPVGLFANDQDVPDPYYTRDFDGALDLIESAAAVRLDQLQNASAAFPKLR